MVIADVAVSNGITIADAAIAFTGVALLGFWREMNDLKKKTMQWQAKIDTTLFGAQGNNGLNGTTKDHEERIRTLELRGPHASLG